MSLGSLSRSQPFGPIFSCQPWEGEEDFIVRADDTKACLASSVFGKDSDGCKTIAKHIENGSVSINTTPKLALVREIFGGMKDSGVGVEWRKLGILAYRNAQAIHRMNRFSCRMRCTSMTSFRLGSSMIRQKHDQDY